MYFVNVKKICAETGNLGEIPQQKEIVKNTLGVAWPSMLESFFVTLAGVIDTIMVSSLGDYAISAVGLTTQPKFFALAFFLALNVSVSALVARRKGEDNRESANRIMKTALMVTILMTAIVSVVFVIFADPIIRIAGSKSDTHEYAVEYFQIIMSGIGFSTVSLILNAAQRGAGNTRIAMVTNVISNVVNVVFNYLLIGGNFGFPALGIRGAAIATVLGTVCAFLLSLRSVLKTSSFVCLRAVKGLVADKLSIKSMVNVWSSAFVEQICLRVGFLLFSITIANLGTVEFAAHQIGMNMMSMSFAFGDGLSVAAVTLIGQSLGKKRPDLAKVYSNVCQKVGLIAAFVISSIYFFFGRDIFALFSENVVILDYGSIIMRILSLVLFLQIEQVIQFGCLRGAGDTRFTALVSLVSVTVIRPGASWLLCYPLGFGLIGAWIGTLCDQLVRFTLTFIRLKKGKWVTLKL